VEQEQLDERLTEMEAQKAQLAADLQATQVNTPALACQHSTLQACTLVSSNLCAHSQS
jgi:hypothetical protein